MKSNSKQLLRLFRDLADSKDYKQTEEHKTTHAKAYDYFVEPLRKASYDKGIEAENVYLFAQRNAEYNGFVNGFSLAVKIMTECFGDGPQNPE